MPMIPWPKTLPIKIELRMKGLNIDLLANSGNDMLERLIEWKLQSPSQHRRKGNRMTAITEGKQMQRQFNIELRVDYEDAGKNDEMKKACAHAARHMFATAQLLADGVKPQISIFSDDFFQGVETIALLEDTIQQGIEQIGQDGVEEQVSSDLMSAIHNQE